MLGNTDTLSANLRLASGQEVEPSPEDLNLSFQANEYLQRYGALKGIPIPIIRQAWFTTAHLLLPDDAKVLDMGCANGQMTYAMAVLNPHLHFIGIDQDRKQIAKANQKFDLPNLEYRVGDVARGEGFEEESLDAIINSFVLHEIYSGSKYHDRAVHDALQEQFTLLKQDGIMFLRGYPMPPPGDMVLMEMPDFKGTGPGIAQMSEPELLLWYAERALPRQDPGCHGFFIEELPPRFPNTKLFRLPYKWAYEFITRKDDRASFEEGLHKEFAFFTKREFRKSLRALGARVLYSSPHWDDIEIKEKFEGRFRLYQDDGTPIGLPPTSFVAVAQKVGEGRSLKLLERRPSNKQDGRIQIRAMRNERDGRIVDIVSREFSSTDVIPYRVNERNELSIFLHEGAPRGITNAVQRTGKNLDEKYWSGHMTEAFSILSEIVAAVPVDDVKAAVHFARDYLGLRPAYGATLEKGPGIYPAPDFIDDFIGTRYIRVESNPDLGEPKQVLGDLQGFTTRGRIREVSAQSVLNAITVGVIPNARLEIQIIALCDRLDVKIETWVDSPLALKEEEPETLFDSTAFAKQAAHEDSRFKSVRGTAGQLRTVQSIFVDEGWVDGGLSGLSARDMEFVISDEATTNKAVVLPLTRTASGTVMAGITTEYLPVPQRFQGNGLTARAPSFDLPKEITNLQQAKKFIADKFGVTPDLVYRLGESFFLHAGVTPQRIFPFAVAAHRGPPKMLGGSTQFFPMKKFYNVMFRIMDWNIDMCTAYAFVKANRFLADTNEQGLRMDFGRQLTYSMFQPGGEKYEDMAGLAGTKMATSGGPSGGSGSAAPAGGRGMPSSKGKSDSKDGGDDSSSGDAAGGAAGAQTSSEPAFIANNEGFVQRAGRSDGVSAKSKGGGGGGAMGGGVRKTVAKPAESKDTTTEQMQAQQIQQQQIQPKKQQQQQQQLEDDVVIYRSEPAFDSSNEDYVERPHNGRDGMDDRPDDKKSLAKSGA
jgi:SAM-dependent methyltransferase